MQKICLTVSSMGFSTIENIKDLYISGAEGFFSSANLSNNVSINEMATTLKVFLVSLIVFFKLFKIKLTASSLESITEVKLTQSSVRNVSANSLSSSELI